MPGMPARTVSAGRWTSSGTTRASTQTRPKALPLDRYFRESEVVMMRSAWDDPHAVSVDFKAGDNKASLSHLDLGSFIIDALGVRWGCTSGRTTTTCPTISAASAGRTIDWRAEGHNTLVIPQWECVECAGPEPQGRRPIVKFDSQPGRVFAIADLKRCLRRNGSQGAPGHRTESIASEYWCRMRLKPRRPSDVWWFMTIPAASTGPRQSPRRGGDGRAHRTRQGLP